MQAVRVSSIVARDEQLGRRKTLSQQVGLAMKSGDGARAEELKQCSLEAGTRADEFTQDVEEMDRLMEGILCKVPNLLDDRVPEGLSEADNEVLLTHGDLSALPLRLGWPADFEPLWHDVVAANLSRGGGLDGWDAERAVRMSGARFFALSGPAARLERALSQFFLDAANDRGYTEVSVPFVVGRSALEGTGQLPKFEEDLFRIEGGSHKCNGEDAFVSKRGAAPPPRKHHT
jgi:seryl-tRNA synthetase